LNNLEIICKNDCCLLQGKPLSYLDLLNHAQNCISKKIKCPINCEIELDLEDINIMDHLEKCNEALRICINC